MFGGSESGGVELEKFSFFVTSLKAMQALSGSPLGFGGDLRFGEQGPGAGLRGADKICSAVAEMSMPGSAQKQWRAFLSVASDADGQPVNAIDRIGEGPWYDRLGRLVVSILQLTRAAIYAELRHTASAHQALERVDLDLVVAQLPDLHKRLGMLLLRLAVLDLADDHIDHVFAHLATARALWSPEMFTDLLRAAPGLQALHSDPRWRALLGE